MDTVQLSIRGVPVAVAENLKARAKRDGKSLNALVVETLTEEAERKVTQEELIAKFAGSVDDPKGIEETLRILDGFRDEWVE
jgi:plasmid stability protein